MTVEAAKGTEGSSTVNVRRAFLFPVTTWEEFEMNRIVLWTVAMLVAVVGFAMMGEDQEATAGLFGRKGGCCAPACCEPAPVCCEPVCGGRKHKHKCGGLFKRMRDRNGCCEPVTCCAPEPTCCAPQQSCGCEAQACGCDTGCGCEAAAPCGCDGGMGYGAPQGGQYQQGGQAPMAPEAAPEAPQAPQAPEAPQGDAAT
jgi:hypothetical protein